MSPTGVTNKAKLATAAVAALSAITIIKTTPHSVDPGQCSLCTLTYRSIINPALRLLDPETAHRTAVRAAAMGLVPATSTAPDPPVLRSQVLGMMFNNPVGLAAGFDKNGEAIDGLLGVGFGFVEIGSVTPLPQPGNPKPRVFRLPEDGAVINRYGFNSDGADAVVERLKKRADAGRASYIQISIHHISRCWWRVGCNSTRSPTKHILGVNLGKNKLSVDGPADYVTGLKKLGPFADYVVINISSPNTPGLRGLQVPTQTLCRDDTQNKTELDQLLSAVQSASPSNSHKPPLLVKIAPDLERDAMSDIAKNALYVVNARQLAMQHRVDGLIVSNTTVSRPATLRSKHRHQTGGLSGRPLRDMSTAAIQHVFQSTGGKLPIIGVGGVESGADAYAKIRAGASLVQIYTGLVYGGPPLVGEIKWELAECLERDGFGSVAEAVGVDAR